ncbi:acylating sulfoacetaldehyde dehydrogenase [Rhodocyclus tenuis]|uniref:Sulfoacetaldehyde dehydrogenase n=1 Tax=Rhodocyclus tenuis TaxID=1066 RepID=A0A840G9T3_RHOTE|nr:aldehyde dehydrogenase family protein [Rhodocyclus tenuis]MBB4248625.1 sulfoacetaldehyde dehydrogenase [Rhodocyclus tenuis]
MSDPAAGALPAAADRDVAAIVSPLIARARAAQESFADADQETVDRVVTAAGWAIVEPGRNRQLAEQAVRETGLGNVADKLRKNRRKTLGLLRDLHGARSVGVLSDDPRTGICEIARPVGVVAAITPSTNPAATPANNLINALKGRNAIILAPSPKGAGTCASLLGYVWHELDKVGAPRDLVQMLPPPASKAVAAELMRQADLVVATGSPANVRAAYASGTPALGVGAGNVAAIVTPAADFAATAARIAESKTFDHATSCSSENSLVIVDEAWHPLLDALRRQGGVLASVAEQTQLQRAMFPDGKLAPAFVAQAAARLATLARLTAPDYASARFIMVEEDATAIGPQHPFSGEKLSPVLTLYRVADFDAAIAQVRAIYDYQGKGHSVGVHGASDAEILRLGFELPVCRVIVEQTHCVAVGGAFDNGLPFSLSMGCGSWGGNSFSDNLNYRHFLNITRIVRPIAPREASEDALFADYWQRYGR